MPLEPLLTDEKLATAAPKERDMDTVMLFGCSGFVVTSVGMFLLALWPFIVFQEVHRASVLGTCAALGLLPSGLAGLIGARRAGLPGACGAIGGAAVTSVFLFLRLQQAFVSGAARQDQVPEYPSAMLAVMPIGWVLLASLAAILVLRKEDADLSG